MDQFKGYLVSETEDGVKAQIKDLTLNDLSEGNVLIKVEYSCLNYKDMLAFQAHGGVMRQYPLVPGMDLAGTVISSEDLNFKSGDQVLCTGYDLSVTHSGGLAEVARIPSEWLTKLPAGMSTRDAMVYGTAGLTAGLSIDALLKAGMKPTDEVLVTGATGGVGSVAVAILAKLGFEHITALVRKPNQVKAAQDFGATATLDAADLKVGKPLQHQSFDYVLDTVGGDVAAALLSMIKIGGAMSACGNAGGHKLQTSILPFILRGISLLGIDSIQPAAAIQNHIWDQLASDWNVIDQLTVDEIGLEDVLTVVEQLKAGQHLGRTIVKVQ
ncbi:quinone oxidoreductase, YhdH/YhfP family [Ligilactobacillus salitolerans]|uniref:Quinone oxidoreductase, YhdH/YhfP family n=1 Tax=Ligilactobacillus salitolerans TaxID=1808352 RepID=A0A401IQU4_9LACO|nr:YhdH/YhfP family quinone oxidoreductase [Ligilactobacillus salitolerans]GBG93892.1 quinone oxidoreductase, YhdH/YhfP family [Ligilactobacillus salitolerans]